jgi:hypothetical protein
MRRSSMRSTRICFAFLLSFSATLSLHADWSRTGNTTGNRINCLVQHGGYLFAGTHGGVFRSSDNGVTWSAVTQGIKITLVGSLCSTGGFVYAGGADASGVFRSSDNGMTWTAANGGVLANSPVNALAAVVDSGRTNLFAGTSVGTYRTTNDGTSWTLSQSVSNGVRVLGIVGTEVYSGGYDGVSRTTNLGATWARADSGITYKYVSSFTSIGSVLYATTYGAGAFTSTNSGVFWTSAGLTGGNIWAITSTGSTLYAAQAGGSVYRSTNGGANWTQLPLPTQWATTVLANGTQVFAGTASGLYTSTNSGTNWAPVVLSSGVALTIAGDSKLYAGSYSGVCVSTNGGTEWSQTGLLMKWVRGIAVSGSVLFAGITGEGAYRSTGGGASWSAATGSISNNSVSSFTVVPGGTGGITVFAGSWGKVYVSSDSGSSWTETGTGLPTTDVKGLAVLGPAMLAGTYNGGVFVSTNNGGNWARQNPSTAKVLSLCLSGNKAFAGTEGGGMLLSADTGKTWTAAGLASATIRALAASGTKVFAGSESGVWLTTDNGGKWSRLNAGLADSNIYSLHVNGTDLFAGVGSGGIWKRPLSELVVGVDEESQQVPVAFGLSQNYPNPFNPSTSISVELPVAGNIRLAVFDLLGREVATLINGRKEAGVHEVVFDASGFPSGVYLYRVDSGSFRATRKMLLVK